ncbi:MAG: type VI secretion system tube protein Hcp [Rhodanobacter sp.]
MATDFFLKIDGIDGESTDDKHKGEIEIESWSWGATNVGSMGPGGGSGKADFSDITISKQVDKSTPKLLKAAAEGQHIKSMLLTCRKARGARGQLEYLKVTLEDVMISSYTSMASGDRPIPSETVGLNYGTIKYEYAPQKSDGSLEGFVVVGYDRRANKAS